MFMIFFATKSSTFQSSLFTQIAVLRIILKKSTFLQKFCHELLMLDFMTTKKLM